MPNTAKQNKALSFDDIERDVSKEIQNAQENLNTKAVKREKSWDRYYGRKLGNEVKGRSQFITREVMDTIEWMMPYLIRTFAAGDPKVEIEIKGQEAWVGKALMDKIQLDLGDATPSIFLLFYQWFKDALVSDTAFVKVSWDLDQETVTVDFDELPAEQMQQLAMDPDVTITKAGTAAINPMARAVIFTNIEAKIKKTIKDGLYVENTPHWEFLVDPKSRDINDEYGKGHQTEVTVDYLKRINRARTEDKKKPYFKNLDRLESGESRSQITSSESEKTNYMGEDEPPVQDTTTEKGAKSPVDFVEWYTRIDVDGDGYLENIVCFMGNNYLLRWEENEDDFIPFSALKPIIDCYKFFGIAFSDLLTEIQNLKTMLFRRILDNFDFQNSGRWLKDPNSGIDTFALLNNIPGSVITGKPDGLKDITPAPFNPSSLSILEYVDTIKANRTGLEGRIQAESLKKTATEIVQIENKATQRMDLIGRIFAELGLKDFYRKDVLLYQKHMRKPFTAKVQGKDREITPDMIQGRVITRVNMGVSAALGAEEVQRIERMLGILFKVNEFFPGILTPENIHNLMSRYVAASGFKAVDDFIGDVEAYVQKTQQTEQQQSEMQKQMIELEQKFRDMEMQLKGQEVQVKADKVKQDGVVAMAEIEQERDEAVMETQQKERDSRRDHKLGLLDLVIKGNQAKQQGAENRTT